MAMRTRAHTYDWGQGEKVRRDPTSEHTKQVRTWCSLLRGTRNWSLSGETTDTEGTEVHEGAKKKS